MSGSEGLAVDVEVLPGAAIPGEGAAALEGAGGELGAKGRGGGEAAEGGGEILGAQGGVEARAPQHLHAAGTRWPLTP